MKLYWASRVVIGVTPSPTRTSAAMVTAKVKTNNVSDHFITGSRKTMAMSRGESWALASWNAMSKADDTKMTNVNIDEASAAKTVRASSGSISDRQPH